MTHEKLSKRIEKLKKEKNAIILAHYYTRPEVQDIADFLGDSLGLSRKAAETDAEIIVFCGVHFMAETATIISPEKKVLIPAKGAGCSLAESVTGYELREWKRENPDGVVVSYVNTTAEVKAYTDYCCTSSNALKVIKSLPEDKKILFVPDKNLGAYITKVTGREMELWQGDCCVHEKMNSGMVFDKMKEYPDADVLIHPESSCSHDNTILNHPNAYMYSTKGIIDHSKSSEKKRFIIATELETLHKLRIDNPDKEFIPIHERAFCRQMKKVTLDKVLAALEEEQYEVKVAEKLRERAKLPISRMLEIG